MLDRREQQTKREKKTANRRLIVADRLKTGVQAKCSENRGAAYGGGEGEEMKRLSGKNEENGAEEISRALSGQRKRQLSAEKRLSEAAGMQAAEKRRSALQRHL